MDERHAPHDGQHRPAVSDRHVSNQTGSFHPIDLLTRANDAFTRRVTLIHAHQWAAPTPSAAWDVRALVNHVVGANRRFLCEPRLSRPP